MYHYSFARHQYMRAHEAIMLAQVMSFSVHTEHMIEFSSGGIRKDFLCLLQYLPSYLLCCAVW